MPATTTRSDYIELLRTFSEMYENLDFIQPLERLKSGEPTSMHGSSSAGKIDGINRSLARLSYGVDILMDQLMFLKTGVVFSADSTYAVWDGTNISTSAGISLKMNLIAAGYISGATNGEITYSISSFSEATAAIDWGYLLVPMDPTASTTLTINTATDAAFTALFESVDRFKIIPVFYKNSAGNIVWLLGSTTVLHQDYNYYPSRSYIRYHAQNKNMQTVGSVNLSGSGEVSWIKNGATAGEYSLTLPNIVFTGPSVNQTVSGAVYSSAGTNLDDGKALFVKLSDGTVSVQALNSTDFSNEEDLRFMVCARDGNEVYFWNGLKLVGTTTASTGTTTDLFRFQEQLIRLLDDSTAYYLEILSNSDADFTGNRSLTLDMRDGDRTLILGGAAVFVMNTPLFSVLGSVDTAVNSHLLLQDGCTIKLYESSGTPSYIDLEAGCYINLDSGAYITGNNSSLAMGTGNTINISANVTISNVFSVTDTCTIDQNLSKASTPQFNSLNLEGSAIHTLSRYINGTQSPTISSRKSRGTSSTPTSVQQSDYLMKIFASGYNAHDTFEDGAYIYAIVTGVPAEASGDMPTSLTFGTSPEGSSSPVERLRLTHDGFIGMGISDPDALLEIYGVTQQLKLSYDGTNYFAVTVDNAGNADLTTSSGGEVKLNGKRARVEEITVVVKLTGMTPFGVSSGYGMGIPTMDKAIRSNQSEFLKDFTLASPDSLANWNLATIKDRFGSIWVAPRDCKIIGFKFSSEVSFGNFSGALGRELAGYPGRGAGPFVVPPSTAVTVDIFSVVIDPGAGYEDGGFLAADDSDVDVTYEDGASFLYASIFNVDGSGTDGTTTWDEHWAGNIVTEEFSVPIDISEGKGVLIRLDDPTGTGASSPENFEARLDPNAAYLAAPCVRITLMVEYPT